MNLAQNLDLGANIGSATIAGVTRAIDGTLTVGTTHTLLTVLESINPVYENRTEEASITPSGFGNNVKLESAVNYSITGFILKNGSVSTPTNWVNAIVQNFDYAQVVHGQSGIINTYVGLIQNYRPIMEGKNALKFECNLLMVDIGGPNPVQS